MDNKQARYLHRMLDRLAEGKTLNPQDVEALRKNLPELPKQKTLEEITEHVYDAWTRTNYNEWAGNIDNPNILLEEWLVELHVQLKGLKDTPAAHPALPAGMQLADHDELGRVVVSPRPNQTFHTEVLFADNRTVTGVAHAYVGADTLTPVGSKPAHPEFLGTEADYHSAPAGTVAGKDGWLVWMKQKNGDWSCDGGSEEASVLAQTGKRRVLRWGWTNE